MWVVGVFDTEAEARFAEASLAAHYGLPMLPFIAWGRDHRRAREASVGNQELIDRLFP